MNKMFKGMLATLLTVGFLAGCGPTATSDTSGATSTPPTTTSGQVSEDPVVTHFVTFWEDNVGKFYEEVEVVHGEKVAMPADPSRAGFTFNGWYLETTYETVFDVDTLINDDLEVFGKWSKDYVPDTRTFHIIGDLQNTEYENTWNTADDHYVNTHLTVADDKNLFTIEIEIGFMGKFKVKIPGMGWDEGQEYDYTDIPEALVPDYVIEGDTRNVQVTTAGLYKVQVETDLNELYIERLSDAVGEGVKPDPEAGSVLNWGFVGSMSYSNWDANPDIELHYNAEGAYHYYYGIFLTADEIFKLRVDNDWAVQIGSSVDNVLPADGSILNTMETVGDVEQVKAGENLVVVETGYYSVFVKTVDFKHMLTIEKMEFALRGTATAGGWDADSAPLAFVSATEVVDSETAFTLEYTATYTFAVGEFKVKLGAFAEVAGWDVAFGDAGGANFNVTAAGDYTVTLTVDFDFATDTFTNGVATFAPVVE